MSEPPDLIEQFIARRDDKLLRDLVLAERDLFSVAAAHRLSLSDLAAWSERSGVDQTVSKLCRLADLQCQVMVSRYRLIAASRLIAQAGNEDGTLNAEQVRKACIDLLKTNPADLALSTPVETDDEDPALTLLQQTLAELEAEQGDA